MSPQPEPSTQEVLAGLVERITYHNAENGFCVLRARARGHRDVVTVVGHVATISAGEWITASGEWVNDRTHGQQVREPKDIAPAIAALKGHTGGIFVQADPMLNTHRVQVNALALSAQLPTMHGLREFVDAGGLISYGPSFPDLYRRAAEFVDKILRGAKPSDVPVEQPTKYELVINLTTAKALGLEIPDELLTLADEVIE